MSNEIDIIYTTEQSYYHLIDCISLYNDILKSYNKHQLDELQEHLFKYCFRDNFIELLVDIEKIAEELLQIYSDIEVINYLEFLLSEVIYEKSLNHLKLKGKMKLSYYCIILCEHLKYFLYEQISSTLVENSPDAKQVIREKVVKLQCKSNKKNCLLIIDKYYKQLLSKKELVEDLKLSNELIEKLEIYKLKEKKNKYEIEIVIEK